MDTVANLTAALTGRYTIERELGAGGMATVYLARDLRHDRRVALKVLRPELAAAVGAHRFLQEIRTTANLQHPHILPLYDSGEVDGTVFYVMPYLEGESVRERLVREKQLPVDDAVEIAQEVAAALEYAHRHGVIHRDIKPENILLPDGGAVVADFGIALAATSEGADRLTNTGLSLGTPSYMSPEQAVGERSLSPGSDIFALGCVLYEMLAGEPPFTGPTAQAIIAKVVTAAPVPLRQLRHTVPLHVQTAVETALEKIPADRWASAAAFAEALGDAARRPAGARTPSNDARSPTVRFPRRALATGAILTVGLAIAAASTWTLIRARSNGWPEPRRYTITLPDSAPLVAGRDHFGIAQRSLAVSRDGRNLVYISAATGGTRLSLARLDIGVVSTLRGTDGARLPTFSPDGRTVAFVAGDSEIRKLSLDDGAITHVTATVNPWALLWVGDGIYFADPGCPRMVSSSGGESRPVGGMPCLGQWLGFSIDPIGARTDWLALDGRAGIQLLSTSTGEVRKLLLPGGAGSPTGAATIPGSSPRFIAPGFIALVRDSSLFAAPFDMESLRFTGDPHAVLTGIRHESVSDHAHMDVALDGTFVWASGGDESLARFVWVRPTGSVQDTAFIPPMALVSYALSPDGKRVAIDQMLAGGRRQLVIADLERHALDRVNYPLELEPTNWVRGGRALAVRVHRANGTVRGGLVTPGSSSPIDTLSWGFYNESANGAYRCRDQGGVGANTIVQDSATAGVVIWKVTGPADSMRVAERGGWCRFSPDARFVAWVSPEGLFVASTDRNLRQSRAQVAPPGADEPRWSAGGKTILYRQAMRWFEVAAPGPGVKPRGPPHVLFEGNYLQAWASWELGPDGRLLLMQGQAPVRLTRLNVITNFPRFLTEKLGTRP